MKMEIWMLILLLITVGLNSNSVAVNAGDPIGEPFMSIQAVSRGAWNPGDPAEPDNLQCVDLARDFAKVYHNTSQDGFGSVGCAANMWNELPEHTGYTTTENDSSPVQPQVGDFVIWWNNGWTSCSSGSGHVAIVSRVLRNEVEVFEQNISPTDPYRLVSLVQNQITRNWSLNSTLGGGYYVKGWLRYPGFSVIGRYDSGQIFHQEIKDCWIRENSYLDVGWAIEDGGGVFVHNWEPFDCLCQNFRRKDGQESIIMHGAPYTGQARLISGLTWEYYRYGYNGHYGPDIRLPNGKTLGCPMSDKVNGIQYFGVSGQRTGYYKEGLKEFQPAKAAEGEPVKTSETYVSAVDLYQLDGALAGTYYSAGELSALTLTAEPMSENHNALAWLGGPIASSYRVLADLRLKRLFDILNLA